MWDGDYAAVSQQGFSSLLNDQEGSNRVEKLSGSKLVLVKDW